jgi:hypothetical protein
MNNKEYLFLKNISDYSISALKELYQEVSLLFEAVRNKKTSKLLARSVAKTVYIVTISIYALTNFKVLVLP